MPDRAQHPDSVRGQEHLHSCSLVVCELRAVALDQRLERLSRRQMDDHARRATEVDEVLDDPRHPALAAVLVGLELHSLRSHHAWQVPRNPVAPTFASRVNSPVRSRQAPLPSGCASAVIMFEMPRKSATNSVVGSS